MYKLCLNLDQYNSTLLSSLSDQESLGLSEGRMGYCLYFFKLSRLTKKPEYEGIAQDLLKEILRKINSINGLGFDNGLTGVVLGLSYLKDNKYIGGNLNLLFKYSDDFMFKKLSYPIHLKSLDILSEMHSLFYLYLRLRKLNTKCESYVLLSELVILLINDIFEKIDLGFFEEESPCNFSYKLPIFLFVLSRIYSLGIYQNKIVRILEELTVKIVTIIPFFHSNRLSLLWGLISIHKQVKLSCWDKHIKLLLGEIDFDIIFNEEMKDKSIYFANGILSIYLLLVSMRELFSTNEIYLLRRKIVKRIQSSDLFRETLKSGVTFSPSSYGLMTGFSGVIFFLNRELDIIEYEV